MFLHVLYHAITFYNEWIYFSNMRETVDFNNCHTISYFTFDMMDYINIQSFCILKRYNDIIYHAT